MFVLEDMIDMGLKSGQKWMSKVHKMVAIEVCIYNPWVNTPDILTKNVQIINSIPCESINEIGGMALIEMGCTI